MRPGLAWCCLLCLGLACTPPPPPKAKPAPPIPVTDTTLAAVGLAAEAMDQGMDPCVNFYLYACGGWDKATDFPKQRAWVALGDLEERRDEAFRTALETATQSDAEPSPLGTFYASCMDESAIELQAALALREPLSLIERVRLPGALAPPIEEVLAALHGIGVPAFFRLTAQPDRATGRMAPLAVQGGLGLPSRQHYLSDAKAAVELRDRYREHVSKMLALTGSWGATAERSAEQVLEIESALAVLFEPELARVPVAESMGRAELRLEGLDLDGYLQRREVKADALLVSSKSYFSGLAKLLRESDRGALASYLRWTLVHQLAPALGAKAVAEHAALGELLEGLREPMPRWRQCVRAAYGSWPELLARPWLTDRTPAGEADGARAIGQTMLAAARDGVRALPWLGEADRRAADAKLAALTLRVELPPGEPPAALEPPQLDPRTHTANVLAVRAARVQRELAVIGKPVGEAWPPALIEPLVAYLPGANELVLTAAALEPPLFDAKGSSIVHMGSLGTAIARAIWLAIDAEGARADAHGRRAAGWTEATATAQQSRAACFVEQYAHDELRAGIKLDSELTLRQNLADVAGLEIAYRAHRKAREAARERQVADGLNEDQQFFLAYAQSQCTKHAWGTETLRAATEPVAQADIRVNGAVRNNPAFAKAFLCSDGTPMAPANRCALW